MPDRQRKWRLALLSMTLITLGFVLVSSVPALIPIYSTFVGAVIGLNAVYGGVNVANKKWGTDTSFSSQELTEQPPAPETTNNKE